jgi:hypothetical protein
MSGIPKISTFICQLVRPAALDPRSYKFDSRSGQSFAEIVKNEKTKRSQECFAQLILEPNKPCFASQKCTRGEETEFIECKASTMIPSKRLERYASLLDIRAVQAVVKVAIKVAEEYLPGREEISEALRNLFFERAEEVLIQEQERKEEKDQVMATAAAANVATA